MQKGKVVVQKRGVYTLLGQDEAREKRWGFDKYRGKN